MNLTRVAPRMIFAIMMATVAFCFNPIIANAVQNPAHPEFKDPYKGGTRLREGGGEPGKAYMALIDAVYKKDHAQICKLITDGDGEVLAQCLNNKEMSQGVMFLLGSPKSHRVADGSMKGDEATLEVAYSWADTPDSYGFVVMKQLKGRWFISSFGGSGSTDIDVQASGTVDLGAPVTPVP